jgi:hypothetical protein
MGSSSCGEIPTANRAKFKLDIRIRNRHGKRVYERLGTDSTEALNTLRRRKFAKASAEVGFKAVCRSGKMLRAAVRVASL